MIQTARCIAAQLLLWSRAVRKREVYRRQRDAINQRAFGTMPRSALSQGDSLFILGTGQSINDISHSQWDEISRAASIGINHFLMHDFAPNVLTIEGFVSNVDKEIYFRNLEVRKTKGALESAFLVTGIEEKAGFPLKRLCESVQNGKIYLLPTITMSLSDACGYSVGVGLYKQLGLFRQRISTNMLWGSFSLVRAIYLGIIFGFNRIVLCGVDLRGPYFFQELEDEYIRRGYQIHAFGEKVSGVHNTANAKLRQVTVIDILWVLRRLICEKRGVELFVGSRQSALHPEFPCYWS